MAPSQAACERMWRMPPVGQGAANGKAICLCAVLVYVCLCVGLWLGLPADPHVQPASNKRTALGLITLSLCVLLLAQQCSHARTSLPCFTCAARARARPASA